MRIVILSHYLPPHAGGIEMVAEQQAVRMAARGNYVVSVAYGHRRDSKAVGRRQKIFVGAWNGLERFGVPFPVFSPRLLWVVFRAVKSADVVHVHDAFYLTSWAGALAAKRYHKPLFVTQHVGLVTHSSKLVSLAERLVYRTYGKYIHSTAKKIFTYNDSVSAFLTASGIPHTKIVGAMNGTDTELFRPVKSQAEKQRLRKKYGLPADRRLVLFAGRLVPKKGYKLLLEAHPKEACALVFAGSTSTPADFRVSSGVYNLGAHPHHQMAEIYRACDLFALPSVSEGFPLSVQEAMASGLPVITSYDQGYDKYMFDDSLMTFVAPTTKELKQALDALLHASKADLKNRGLYGRHYAEKNFSWDRLIDTQIAAYERAAR